MIESGDVTEESINEHVKGLLNNCYIIALIGGNVSEDWAKDAMRMAVDTLKCTPLSRRNIHKSRITKLSAGMNVITRKQHSNPEEEDGAVAMSFQFDRTGDFQSDVTIALLSKIMNAPLFHELRTVQQLGYTIVHTMRPRGNAKILEIYVQSSALSPDKVAIRIGAFLHGLPCGIWAMMSSADSSRRE